MKILMVCLGNICRSPLAEGILQHKVGKNHQIDSAGTGDWHVGELPDHRSIEVAKNHGVDITYQRAQHFAASFFDEFDLIYAMDENNLEDLQKLTSDENQKSKIKLFLEDAFGKKESVPDPYYGQLSDFEHVYQLVDQATDKIIEKYNL